MPLVFLNKNWQKLNKLKQPTLIAQYNYVNRQVKVTAFPEALERKYLIDYFRRHWFLLQFLTLKLRDSVEIIAYYQQKNYLVINFLNDSKLISFFYI